MTKPHAADGADRHQPLGLARLEAFSDGVFAIALTLLIIEIKIPRSEGITGTRELWRALGHLTPPFLAFLLSFVVVLISWVNHSRFLRLVDRAPAPFVYANGLLLLTVVVMPFPTALLGEYLLTDEVAPAVVIYNAVTAVQALAWILAAGSALSRGLLAGEAAITHVRDARRNGAAALVVYSSLALAAAWFPLTIAVLTTLLWAYWLIYSLRSG